MNNNNKKQQKVNPLEVFRDLGQNTSDSLKNDLARPMVTDAFEQIFGQFNKAPTTPRSGEIHAGEKVGMNDIVNGDREKAEKYQKMLIRERQIRQEEHIFVERRTNELRVEIQTLIVEMQSLAETAPKLTQELEIAVMNADDDDATIYNRNFFVALAKTIKDKVKDINHSLHWLEAFNNRSQRKNVWGQNYKKHGAKYLLSGEHYASRSAA